MIERSNHNEIMFVCDGCGEAEQTGSKEFTEALAEVKQAGWVARKEDDEWQHLCGDCK